MRKILIILTIVLVLAAIIAVIWSYATRNPDSPVGEVVSAILPFGIESENEADTFPPDNTEDGFGNDEQVMPGGNVSVNESASSASELTQISGSPIAGVTSFKKNGKTVIRYVERATGHIYDATISSASSSATIERKRVTNNTLPKIYEAYFRSDGNMVLIRSLKEDSDVIENMTLTLTPPKTGEEFYTASSTLLRGSIGDVTVGPNDTLIYSLSDTGAIVSSSFTGANTKQLFTSSFNNWRISSAANNVVINTKASSAADGYGYKLNPTNGALSKIVGPLDGLVVLPGPSGQILYSYVEERRVRLFAQSEAGAEFVEVSPSTFAEKCVWSRQNRELLYCGSPITDIGLGEPDNWYRGLTHFSDRIWLFDLKSDTSNVLREPDERSQQVLDISNPTLTPDEDYLVFINKNDLSLWMLPLK